jgi:hypothetical protein
MAEEAFSVWRSAFGVRRGDGVVSKPSRLTPAPKTQTKTLSLQMEKTKRSNPPNAKRRTPNAERLCSDLGSF